MKKFAETIKAISDIATAIVNVFSGVFTVAIAAWVMKVTFDESHEQD